MRTPILGASYVARSVNAADNRCVNLYAEIVPEGGKEAAFLSRAPGLRPLTTLVGAGPVRGLWVMADQLYVATGTEVWRYTSLTVAAKLGDISGTGPVSIADNGRQVFFACNGPSFVYDSTTNVFGPIVDPDFPGAVNVGFLDQYFVFNEPNSQRVWVTAIGDGTDIDALDYASAEGNPDNVVALIVDHREVWLFGPASTEVWYNNPSGSDFPLQRVQGAFNELGCAAPYSVAKMDNRIFWLGGDARGDGIVYAAEGYMGRRISTHAVEWQIQQYSTLSDAVAFTYQQDGHSFYVLTFPTGNATWVYDVATQSWHERAYFSAGVYSRHRSNCQAFFLGETIVGDYQSNKLYVLDLNVYADDGAAQRWLRSWRALPTGQNNLKRTVQHELQLDCETGVGLSTGQGSNPQVMLRWSDDGGHTWSNEHWRSMGAIGAYGYRTIWRRLGMTTKIRDRVYEISGSDPVKIAIMGAELRLSPTNA